MCKTSEQQEVGIYLYQPTSAYRFLSQLKSWVRRSLGWISGQWSWPWAWVLEVFGYYSWAQGGIVGVRIKNWTSTNLVNCGFMSCLIQRIVLAGVNLCPAELSWAEPLGKAGGPASSPDAGGCPRPAAPGGKPSTLSHPRVTPTPGTACRLLLQGHQHAQGRHFSSHSCIMHGSIPACFKCITFSSAETTWAWKSPQLPKVTHVNILNEANTQQGWIYCPAHPRAGSWSIFAPILLYLQDGQVKTNISKCAQQQQLIHCKGNNSTSKEWGKVKASPKGLCSFSWSPPNFTPALSTTGSIQWYS